MCIRDRYEVIIYGGGLYAGGLSGIKLIKENWNRLSSKKIILFTCGIADPANPENISSIRTSLGKTLSPEMMSHIRFFHLRGCIDYSELSLIHKSMMAMPVSYTHLSSSPNHATPLFSSGFI